MVVDAQLFEHAKNQYIVHLKLVDCMVCEYLNKTNKNYDVQCLHSNIIYHEGE